MNMMVVQIEISVALFWLSFNFMFWEFYEFVLAHKYT